MSARPGESPAAVARHEAGHAVVAAMLAVPIRRVSIMPDGESLGRVACDLPCGGPIDELVRLACVQAAGTLAERMDAPNCMIEAGGSSDHETLRAIANVATFGANEAAAFETWIRARTAAIVARLHEPISLVAAALHMTGELDGDDVIALCQPRSSPVPALAGVMFPEESA